MTGGQSMEFLDRDLEFLAGTGAGEGLDFYDVKDITVNYQCAGEEVVDSFSFLKSIFVIELNSPRIVFVKIIAMLYSY